MMTDPCTNQDPVSAWHHRVDSHTDLTPRIVEVLHQAIVQLSDANDRHLDRLYTEYLEKPEPGQECRHCVLIFSDGAWLMLGLQEDRRGYFGRDSIAYVRCLHASVLESHDEYIGGVQSRRYLNLDVLKDAGLLTADDITRQRHLESLDYRVRKQDHDRRMSEEEVARTARKIEREQAEWRRLSKKYGTPEADKA